jgi:hypothetical protein
VMPQLWPKPGLANRSTAAVKRRLHPMTNVR